MLKLLHTADLHLDWAFEPLPADRRAIRRCEVFDLFQQVVALALEQEVQALVIAGDLLGTQIPPREQRLALIAGFSSLADRDIPVFLTPGHDESPLGILDCLMLPDNVHILKPGAPSVSRLAPGLTVYGFPPARQGRPLENFRRLDRPGFHLGVAHGTYTELPGAPAERRLSIPPDDIADSGLDYLALGHYHEYFSCVHGETPAVYPGSPARLDLGQESARSALLVTLGEGSPRVERLTLNDRPYLDLSFDLPARSFAEILAALEARADPAACARAVLTGTIADGIDFFADRIRERLAKAFFHLEVADRTRVSPAPSGDPVQDLFVRRSRAALIALDLTPGERAVEEYALRAGLIALRDS